MRAGWLDDSAPDADPARAALAASDAEKTAVAAWDTAREASRRASEHAREAARLVWKARGFQKAPRRTRCDRCGWSFPNDGFRPRRFCSKRCGEPRSTPANSVRIRFEACRCGVVFVNHGKGKDAGACGPCRRRDGNRRRNVKRRRAAKGQSYMLAGIGMRDGWRCHLCKRKIDSRLPSTHPQGPTVDHLVPISAGGIDDPSNVALAHKRCNLSRGAGGEVQLRLVG